MTGTPKTHHPQDTTNFVSKIILWWIFPLLWKGTRSSLNREDLYPIRDVEKSRRRTDLLEEKWREEILFARAEERKPKLWRAIIRYYKFQEYWNILPLGLTCVCSENIIFFATISLLGQLTNSYSNKSHGDYYVYIYGIAIGSVLRSVCKSKFDWHHNVLGVRARAGVLGLLYKKVGVTMELRFFLNGLWQVQ